MRTSSFTMLSLLLLVPTTVAAGGAVGGTPGTDSSVKALWKSTGEARYAHEGFAVAMADLDGDGDADMLVGAPDLAAPGMRQAGAVQLFLTEQGRPADEAQDELWGGAPEARFGFTLANAGDVDGDGVDEVLVVSPGEPGLAGDGLVEILELHDGMLTFADWYVTADDRAGGFQLTAAPAGDLNADGYADVVVGQPGHMVGRARTGGVCVYLGGPEGLLATKKCIPGPAPESRFGAAAGGVGDVNGDGFDDLLVGAPGIDKDGMIGSAFVFPGGPEGIGQSPMWTASSEVGFGQSFAALGDLDHDGADEFAIGSPEEHRGIVTRVGAVFVFSARPPQPGEDEAFAVMFGGVVGGRMGATLATADLDADGQRELLVGSTPESLDEAGHGRLTVYAFWDGGHAYDRLLRLNGDQAWAHYAHALAAGDVVGNDGRDEVLVGAPGWSGQWQAEGMVELVSIDP